MILMIHFKILLVENKTKDISYTNYKMIGQFAKRPESRHKSNLRPVTGRASEENIKQSNECFEIAKKYMIKKEYDQALKHYTNATIHNPGNFKALCNMGRIYKETGKFNEARNCYHKALFSNSNDPITLYNLANLQRISGNDQIAIQLYKKVISLKQNQNVDVGSLYFDSNINQGICYKNLQFYDQAVVCNDKAIQISPNDESGHFNKAMCILKKIYTLLRTNFASVKKQLCIEDEVIFKKVLGINPNNFTAKVALIELGYLADPSEAKLTSAVQQLQKLDKIAPQIEKYQLSLKIKYCKNQLKKLDEAKIILQPKNDIVQRIPTSNKYDNDGKNQNSNKPKQGDSKPKLQQSKNKQQDKKLQKPSSKAQNKQMVVSQGTIVDRTKIESLIEAKKFSQAFQLASNLPDGIDKFELQIIVNYLQCVEEENQIYLESAIGIYTQYIIKNNENTPITRETCSEKGHEVMATMLTVYGNYAQASKHYEVLLNLVQDKKFQNSKSKQSQQKLKEIHVQLGICYAERGLVQQAISEYKKSLQMQPDNYFLMTNLCGLLIQDNKKDEARKYYEDYLKKNNWQKMDDKASYIDSLLNISICLRETQGEQTAIEKTIEAVEKFFPTMESIKSGLHEQAILGLYLRYIQILEQKSEKVKPGSLQRRQLSQKMLETNLTCLNFENCPDREALCVNTGILFYLNGCYANALSFYKAVVFNKKIIANNIALALLQMSQYERGANWLQLAIQQNPDNIIYPTNLEIVKWICGMQDRTPSTKYECRCETMYQTRAQLGLHLINQLTTMIDEGEVKVILQEGSNEMDKQVLKLFNMLMERCQKRQMINRNQIWKLKSKVMHQILDRHMKQSHSQVNGNVDSQKNLVPDQILDLSLSKAENSQKLTQNLNKIMDYLDKLSSKAPEYAITQNLVLLQILTNSNVSNIQEAVKALINKRQIKNITPVPQSLETKQFKQSNRNSFERRLTIQFPTSDLKFKTIQSLFRQTQCNIENQVQFLIESIENFYYIKPQNILAPLFKDYLYPHCDNSTTCIRCFLSSSHLYSSLFANKVPKIGEKVKISKKWNFKQEIAVFEQTLQKYVEKGLQSEANNVYSKANKEIHVKFDYKKYPILLKTHHKSFSDVTQFLKRIDNTFSIAAEPAGHEKGIRIVEINKCLILEMYWGNTTVLDRFCHWLNKRQTSYPHDAILMIEDIKQLSEIFQDKEKSVQKITAALYKDQ